MQKIITAVVAAGKVIVPKVIAAVETAGVAAGMAAGTAVGVVAVAGVSYIIYEYKTQLKQIKNNKDTSIQQKKQQIEQLNQSICHQIFELSETIELSEKENKKYICFIGPTSVGKSTLCNDLFKLNLQTGIGKTTVKIQKIYQDKDKVYFDVPGRDNDWQLFQEQDVVFFKSVDRCFLLYVGEVKEVKFIATLLSKMGKQLIFVRNQCDKHKNNMKSIDSVLQQDRDQLNKMEIKYTAVIPSGVERRDEIEKWI